MLRFLVAAVLKMHCRPWIVHEKGLQYGDRLYLGAMRGWAADNPYRI